jgi:hypothetical protein
MSGVMHMITLRDLASFCDLTEDEIEAISQHEHEPIVLALTQAKNLLDDPKGYAKLSLCFEEEIRLAQSRGDTKRACELKTIYSAFARTHKP